MASFLVIITSNVFNHALFFCVLMASMLGISMVSSYQFDVGGEKGWVKPTGNETRETYNVWATRNRFQIGDTIHFKYKEDSVLVVNSSDYQTCNASKPISKFEDGNTVFQFDRSGFFYFISGQRGHCMSGQRLIIRVMHPSEVESPAPAPATPPTDDGGSGGGVESPAPATPPPDGGSGGGDIWGPPGLINSATTKLNVASYCMTVLGAVVVILY